MGYTMDALKQNDDTVIDFISRTSGVSYSDEQLAILRHRGGMCILASAGSGKTTVLNHLIAKRVLTREIHDPNKLLCTTYSKAGATELSNRLNKLLESLGVRSNITVKTLHAVYYKLLKDLGYTIKLTEDWKRRQYIREACKETKVTLDDDSMAELDSILSFQVNSLMSDSALYKSYVYTIRDYVDEQEYANIRQLFSNKKQENGEMDFDDMQLFVYTLLKDKTYGQQIREYCHSLWEYIYIDEAQDTSKIQFEILKMLIVDPSKLVFIGDDDQCIYSWRGSDPNILLNICGIYTQLTRFTLTTNYRCLSEIVSHANVGIKFNTTRSDKEMKPYANGGTIKVCDIGQYDLYQMSKYAFSYITDLVNNNGVMPDDIAVLCRNNLQLTILGNMLFKAGIFCKQADEMKFTKCSMYKNFVSSLLEISQNTFNSKIVGSSLWKISRFMTKRTSNEIGKLQESYGLPLMDTLGLLLQECGGMDIGWKPKANISMSTIDKVRYQDMLGLVKLETLESLKYLYYTLRDCNKTEAAKLVFEMFRTSTISMFKGAETSRFANGFVSYIEDLLEHSSVDDVMYYLRGVSQFEDGGMAVMSPMVTLSTMHSAKGKEWKYVIIFADDNITFPSFQNITNYIKAGVPISDIKTMIDEDRRLHYVAMTRAKDTLVIMGAKKNIGVYTLESFGIFDYGDDNDNNIVYMAQHGMYQNLIDEAAEKLFSNYSPYYMTLKEQTPV